MMAALAETTRLGAFEAVMLGLLALAVGIAVAMAISEMKDAAHSSGRWQGKDWGV